MLTPPSIRRWFHSKLLVGCARVAAACIPTYPHQPPTNTPHKPLPLNPPTNTPFRNHPKPPQLRSSSTSPSGSAASIARSRARVIPGWAAPTRRPSTSPSTSSSTSPSVRGGVCAVHVCMGLGYTIHLWSYPTLAIIHAHRHTPLTSRNTRSNDRRAFQLLRGRGGRQALDQHGACSSCHWRTHRAGPAKTDDDDRRARPQSRTP